MSVHMLHGVFRSVRNGLPARFASLNTFTMMYHKVLANSMFNGR